MSDDEDLLEGLLTGLTNSTPGRPEICLDDLIAMNAEIENLAKERPFPVKFVLTEADYARLLAPYRMSTEPNEFGIRTVASTFGAPVFYGERSEIHWSDGRVEPLERFGPHLDERACSDGVCRCRTAARVRALTWAGR